MMTRLEYLNNLLYAVTGSYYSSENEVYDLSLSLGILTADESSNLYNTYMDKDKSIEYIKRAFLQVTNEQMEKIKNIEPQEDKLPELLEIFLSFS